MRRSDGETKQGSRIENIFTTMTARRHRALISDQIRAKAGVTPQDAERPSVHLRFALEQMRTRGWTNEQWGSLIADYDTGQMGDGPVCILESVRAPFDSPGTLDTESIEQKYIRAGFRQLLDDEMITEIPVYVSEWNDAQETFEPIEAVMMAAIILAEGDERGGHNRFGGLDQGELMVTFGLTKAAIERESAKLDAEAAADAKTAADRLYDIPSGTYKPEEFLGKLLGGEFDKDLRRI
jgi:hypothetical protein